MIVDGAGAQTVFNGLIPFRDKPYNSFNTFIACRLLVLTLIGLRIEVVFLRLQVILESFLTMKLELLCTDGLLVPFL